MTQKAIKNDFNIDENTLTAMHENENGSEYYRKVIKEKVISYKKCTSQSYSIATSMCNGVSKRRS